MTTARAAPLIVLLALSACSRGLTQNETDVAGALFGDTLDTAPIRVMAGIGVTPLPRPPEPVPGASPAEPRAAPDGLCERKQQASRQWDWPAAFVLYDKMYFSYDYYAADAFAGFPASVPYPASLIMAHELVHVWQWQNRARTGYTIQDAGGETVESVDPYWFEVPQDAEFFAYGYEQQGALVQDFVCYALFDRDDPKLEELAGILRPVLPVDDFLAAVKAGR